MVTRSPPQLNVLQSSTTAYSLNTASNKGPVSKQPEDTTSSLPNGLQSQHKQLPISAVPASLPPPPTTGVRKFNDDFRHHNRILDQLNELKTELKHRVVRAEIEHDHARKNVRWLFVRWFANKEKTLELDKKAEDAKEVLTRARQELEMVLRDRQQYTSDIEKEYSILFSPHTAQEEKFSSFLEEFKTPDPNHLADPQRELDQLQQAYELLEKLPDVDPDKKDQLIRALIDRANEPHAAMQNIIKAPDSMGKLEVSKRNVASGGFGEVAMFRNKNGDQFAGKIIYKNTKNKLGITSLENECYPHSIIPPHPNIAKTHGIANVTVAGFNTQAIIMEKIKGKSGLDFKNALENYYNPSSKTNPCGGRLSYLQFVGIQQLLAADMASAATHMHQHKWVHNDIKPHNYMVDESGKAILLDFGSAKRIGTNSVSRSPFYASPENRANEIVKESSDVYTVGRVARMALLPVYAFQNEGKICKDLYNDYDEITEHSASTRFLKGTLHHDPAKRIPLDEKSYIEKKLKNFGPSNDAMDFLYDVALDENELRTIMGKIAKGEELAPVPIIKSTETQQWEDQKYIENAREKNKDYEKQVHEMGQLKQQTSAHEKNSNQHFSKVLHTIRNRKKVG